MLVRGGELLLPLITIPMLVNSLGLPGYGEYVLAQTVVSYLVILINFGFDDVGVKLVSSSSIDDERNRIAINVLYIKLALLLVSSVVYFPIVLFLNVNHSLYVASFLLLVGDVVNIYWFFQGVEKLKYVSLASFAVKIIYVLSVWFFIKTPDDISVVPIIVFVAFVLGNIRVYYFFCRFFMKKFYAPDPHLMKDIFFSARFVFLSNMIIAIKDKAGNIVAGIFIGKEALAIYDLINKLMLISNQPATIINAAFFPSFSRGHNTKMMNNILKILLCSSLIIVAISVPVVWWFIPSVFLKSEPYLFSIQVSFFSCLFYSISFFVGRNIFVAQGMMSDLFVGVILTSIFYIFCMLFFWGVFDRFTIASLVVITVLTYFFEMVYRVFIAWDFIFPKSHSVR